MSLTSDWFNRGGRTATIFGRLEGFHRLPSQVTSHAFLPSFAMLPIMVKRFPQSRLALLCQVPTTCQEFIDFFDVLFQFVPSKFQSVF